MRFDCLSSRLVLVTALAAGVLPCSAGAAAVYDGFGYPANEDLSGKNGGAGWAGAWVNQGFGPLTLTTTPGLSFGSLAVTPGAATTPVGITTYPRSFTNTFGAPGTFYLSFLLRPEVNFVFYGGLNLGGGLFIGKSGPVDTYSIEGGPIDNIAASTVVAQANTTVLLVLRAQFQAGNDLLELFVNPVPGLPEPGAASATMTNIDLGPSDLLYINNAGGWTIDEIRLGSTFADVTPTAVPVPSSSMLIAGGLAAFGFVRRRAKRSLQ